MSPFDSKLRLATYIGSNVCAAAVAGIVSVDFKDAKAVWVFGLGLLGVVFTTIRSYIDKPPTEVTPKPKDP